MKVKFDENIAEDQVECWGISVPLLKDTLFASSREERRRIVEKKVLEAVNVFLPTIESFCGKVDEITVSLASAWTRYYVFKLDVSADETATFALNVLAPNSPLKSFKDVVENVKEVVRKFPQNVAKPLTATNEYMLQEWVTGKPLSDFRDGDILRDVENARKCIPMVAELLYRLNCEGYVYYPWDDYEVMLSDTIVLLDITRFVRRRLRHEEFFDFYFGAPFTPPEIIKPSSNPAHRLYWRGVSEKDYFGTSREEYIRLFLLGVAKVCKSYEEFLKVCTNLDVEPEEIWQSAFEAKN